MTAATRGREQPVRARAKRASREPAGRAPDFDVEKGHQSPCTGFLGALFLLSLFAGYNVWGVYELAGAGPQIALLFSILPERFQIHDVNRNFLDLLLMV